MNCTVKMISVVALASFLMATPVFYGYAKEPNQTTCPVLDRPVKKNVYVDYKGKRVYFCCPPCIGKFNKEPEKYLKKFEEQGVVLENAPGPQK